MKKILTYLLLFMGLQSAMAQGFPHDYIIDFESGIGYISIDTASNPNNVWQIGQPLKTLFDTAYSGTNAIVTDTLNPYPINDTSSFTLTHVRSYKPLWGGNTFYLNFWYKIDTDSAGDYGMVEMSNDGGMTWIDILTQATNFGAQWIGPLPSLSGQQAGWQYFSLEAGTLSYMGAINDTVLYRFTFISDSIQNNYEGWMIDEISIWDDWEGLSQYPNDYVSLYPNPSTGLVHLESNFLDLVDCHMHVYNATGELLLDKPYDGALNLDLPNGTYYLRVFNGTGYVLKPFTISR